MSFLRRRSDEDDGFECPRPITCQFPRCNCGKDDEEEMRLQGACLDGHCGCRPGECEVRDREWERRERAAEAKLNGGLSPLGSALAQLIPDDKS